MSENERLLVSKRPSVACPTCGKESYQRIAEDGESILLLGKGQRFNVKTGEIRWNCKHCGSEHTIKLFHQENPIKKSYAPKVTTVEKNRGNN